MDVAWGDESTGLPCYSATILSIAGPQNLSYSLLSTHLSFRDMYTLSSIGWLVYSVSDGSEGYNLGYANPCSRTPIHAWSSSCAECLSAFVKDSSFRSYFSIELKSCSETMRATIILPYLVLLRICVFSDFDSMSWSKNDYTNGLTTCLWFCLFGDPVLQHFVW